VFAYYHDILDRIPQPPSWWDENGVPRFCDFHPQYLANIYANEAALLIVACQMGPVHHFRVALSATSEGMDKLARQIRENMISYGDPPGVAGCNSPDMGSVEIAVVEYWRNPGIRVWERDATLEIGLLKPGWEHRSIPTEA
jgi:hypothetical protein